MDGLRRLNALWDRYAGPAVRRGVVLAMFLGIPFYVWWVASGAMAGVQLDSGIRWGLGAAMAATMAFGGASAFLVWRDLDREP